MNISYKFCLDCSSRSWDIVVTKSDERTNAADRQPENINVFADDVWWRWHMNFKKTTLKLHRINTIKWRQTIVVLSPPLKPLINVCEMLLCTSVSTWMSLVKMWVHFVIVAPSNQQSHASSHIKQCTTGRRRPTCLTWMTSAAADCHMAQI